MVLHAEGRVLAREVEYLCAMNLSYFYVRLKSHGKGV